MGRGANTTSSGPVSSRAQATLNKDELVLVATRTGGKIHGQSKDSSVTICGHWQKASGSYFEVDGSSVEDGQLCERCFPTKAEQEQAKQVQKPVKDFSYLGRLSLEELRAERQKLNLKPEIFFAAKRIIEGKALPEDAKRLGIASS